MISRWNNQCFCLPAPFIRLNCGPTLNTSFDQFAKYYFLTLHTASENSFFLMSDPFSCYKLSCCLFHLLKSISINILPRDRFVCFLFFSTFHDVRICIYTYIFVYIVVGIIIIIIIITIIIFLSILLSYKDHHHF